MNRSKWRPPALAIAVLIIIAGSVALITGGDDPGAEARKEARRAHCLSAKHRPRLVETAINLDIATPGSTVLRFRLTSAPGTDLSLTAWSAAKGDGEKDFDRACSALAATTAKNLLEPPDQLWLKEFLTSPVVNLLLGALLTAVFGAYTARRARLESLGDAMSSSVAAFCKAADDYVANLDSPLPSPSDSSSIDASRTDLREAVHQQAMSEPAKEEIIRRLDLAHRLLLGEDAAGWSNARKTEIHRSLAELRTAISQGARGRLTVMSAHAVDAEDAR